MSFISSIATEAKSLAHYMDQPQVVNAVNHLVNGPSLYALFGLKAAYDIFTVSPEKRTEVAIKDGFILTPTLFATKYGLKELSEHPGPLPAVSADIIKKYPFLRKLFGRVKKVLVNSCHGHSHGKAGSKVLLARDRFSLGEIRKIITTVEKHGKGMAKNDLAKIFPIIKHDHGAAMEKTLRKLFEFKLPGWKLIKEFRHDKMVKFFYTGGLIVLAGMAGGILYDYFADINDKKATVNKIKESLFQLIANIALCAVGASAGITISDFLKLTEKAIKYPQKAFLYRGTRTGLIVLGLLGGIIGGGSFANWIGRKFVNPFFEWLEKRHNGYTLKQVMQNSTNKEDRKVEFMDGILHLDDVPTAMALAGSQIFMPIIPLFFAISGYRAGAGYRNHHHGKSEHHDLPKQYNNLQNHHNLNYKLNPRYNVRQFR